MLAKQGWRLMPDKESLLYKCFSARYFPRSHFLDSVESPNCSYVWRSIMAALPILKARCCWRVRDGSTIKVQSDNWIPNYPTNRVFHSFNAEVEDWLVSDLIDQKLHWWRRDLITTIFHREDADVICQILLSRRQVDVSIFWLHTRNGGYSVKLRYHVARQGEVMAAKGPPILCNEKVETLACKKALEFAIDAGFLERVVEGDNVNVMRVISSSTMNFSMIGNVIADIHCLHGLGRVGISCIKRGGKRVAHDLAKYARLVDKDMYWMEELPQVAVEAMYQDSFLMNT
ncbi:hypothetical protein SO802_002590 [Lithocarpus litseifolius]|uniref:RNase H type-1 domain-containing protein n=1 Tax=Lithocarpus litseifolius TaxID=425828 RepID=A0AAW2DYK0_9ROSI